MQNLKYWDTVRSFTASDATCLVLGLEPVVDQSVNLSSYHLLMREFHKSFLDTCAHFRYCIERDLSPSETHTWRWQYDTDEEIVWLASEAMLDVVAQIESAKNLSAYLEAKFFGLAWFEQAIDEFKVQRFSREKVADWLYDKTISSAYSFGIVEPETPAQRREKIRQLVDECDGNKSEAARRLGISRTRVDQLLLPSKTDMRKPLQALAQDPFNLTGASRRS